MGCFKAMISTFLELIGFRKEQLVLGFLAGDARSTPFAGNLRHEVMEVHHQLHL